MPEMELSHYPYNLQLLANTNEQVILPILQRFELSWDDLPGNFAISDFIGKEVMGTVFRGKRLRNYLIKAADQLLPLSVNIAIAEAQDPDFVNRTDLATKIQNLGFTWFLMRPDMYHMREEAIEFMRRNKYQFKDEQEVNIGGTTYWEMYQDAILTPNADPVMPTRTMVYMNGPCRAMFFIDNDPKRIPENSSRHKDSFPEERINRYKFCVAQDVFHDLYKGTQGIPTPNTIRGELVFKEAVFRGYHTLNHPTTAMALDPLHAYRNSLNSDVWKTTPPHERLPTEHQLLQYTGVGIHIPNGKEYVRDLVAILDLQTLQRINSRITN